MATYSGITPTVLDTIVIYDFIDLFEILHSEYEQATYLCIHNGTVTS